MNTSKVSRAIRLALAFGAASSISLSSQVLAEDTSTEKQVERITVTGSKIKRIGELSPTPVTVITSDDLVNAAITNVADLLNEIPTSSVGLSTETTNETSFSNGISNTDLRGLGIAKTLVLVNGRRFVSGSTESAAVDLNNIPTAMIDRVEITTGGASAVYGSDAVAGVVNIITKKSFDGFELDASTTVPTEKGGEEKYASFTFGGEVKNSSFIVNVSYSKQEQLAAKQRDFMVNGPLDIDSVDNVDDQDGIPRRTVWKQGNSTLGFYSQYGDLWGYNYDTGEWQYSAFAADGSLNPVRADDPFPLSATAGSTNGNYFAGEGDGYSFLDHTYLRTPLERTNVSANYNYEINDNHSMSLEFLYADSSAYGEMSPTFQSAKLQPDNAFMTEQAKETLPWWFASDVYFTTGALGNRKFEQEKTTTRAALVFEGYLGENWAYDAYIQKGKVSQLSTWQGEFYTKQFNQAIDAIEIDGEIVCADRVNGGAIPGCSPLNLWGEGLASQEAIDYVSASPTRKATIDQMSLGLTVSGDLIELPAGPVASAFTFEYRDESLETTPSKAMAEGLIFGNQTLAQKGDYNVAEAAIELSVPLISDSVIADSIYLELAYRYMDYSSTGADSAWKVGLNYVLNDQFKMRANLARSVRAPNITELFAAPSTDYKAFGDPCGQGAIDNSGELFREANCREAGIPEGWEPSDNWNLVSHPGTTSGNPDLNNEVADDYTIGFIYNPSWAQDLSITVDYWAFEIESEIITESIYNITTGCYDSVTLDNPYCDLIERTEGTNEIDNYYLKPINAASTEVSGTDIEVNYTISTDWGIFSPRLIAVYQNKRERNSTGIAGEESIQHGLQFAPRWRAVLITDYVKNDFAATLRVNYRHSSVGDNEWTIEKTDYNNIPSYTTIDLTARYNVSDDIEVRAGVLNMFDRKPPNNPWSYNQGAYYDMLGQRINLGLKFNF